MLLVPPMPPPPLSELFPPSGTGRPERGPMRRLSSWFKRATSVAPTYDPLVKPSSVDPVYPFVYPPAPSLAGESSTATPPSYTPSEALAFLAALARQADELPPGTGTGAGLRHMQLAQAYLDGMAVALHALLSCGPGEGLMQSQHARLEGGAGRCAEFAVWHLAAAGGGPGQATSASGEAVAIAALRADVERRLIRIVLDTNVRVHPLYVDTPPLRRTAVYRACDGGLLELLTAKHIDALHAHSVVQSSSPTTPTPMSLPRLLARSRTLHAVLGALVDRLALDTPPHALAGIVPGIDPEMLAQWLPLQGAVMRLRLALAIVSREARAAAGEADARAGDEGGGGGECGSVEGKGKFSGGLVELDDEELEVDKEPLVEEDAGEVKLEKDSALSLGSKRRRTESGADAGVTKRLKTDLADFAVLSPPGKATDTAAPEKPSFGVDAGRDLVAVLDLVEDFMHSKTTQHKFGCGPQAVAVLTRRRPWVIDEHAHDSDDEEGGDTSEEDESESDESPPFTGHSRASDASGIESPTGTRHTSPRPSTPAGPAAEAPPALLSTLFTLYDRYTEQRRAVWMELPFPKIKCDLYTEDGAVGRAWRKVMGELVFRVIGTAAAIKLGMDETQLEKWQAENDSLLRPTQRREYKAK